MIATEWRDWPSRLLELDPADALVVLLCAVDGFCVAEVAEMVDEPVAVVQGRLAGGGLRHLGRSLRVVPDPA